MRLLRLLCWVGLHLYRGTLPDQPYVYTSRCRVCGREKSEWGFRE